MKQAHLEILNTLKSMEARGQLDRASFHDIPIEVYHHPECPGYSSSLLKVIKNRSLLHLKEEKAKRSGSLRIGSAFHTFRNEPHLWHQTYEVVQSPDRTSAEWRAAKAKNADQKILLTLTDFHTIEAMSESARNHPDVQVLVEGALHEVTYFSRDEETGILKKVRHDNKKGLAISDWKSTRDASLVPFTRDAKKFDYRLSAAMYLEVPSEVDGIFYRDFFLLPIENSYPYATRAFRVDDYSISEGTEDLRKALRTLKKILDDGPKAWMGYQLGITDIRI